jgi:hypothetical protein
LPGTYKRQEQVRLDAHDAPSECCLLSSARPQQEDYAVGKTKTTATATPTSPDASDLAADILRGAQAIGRFIGLPERQTFHGLQQGHIPATKEGRVWVTTKSRLRRHYNETRFEPSSERIEAA